jgi:hypothetical protein
MDLGRICPARPTYITPLDQVFATADHVSTPASLRHTEVTSGRPSGLSVCHQAPRDHWPPLLADVLRHSVA